MWIRRSYCENVSSYSYTLGDLDHPNLLPLIIEERFLLSLPFPKSDDS